MPPVTVFFHRLADKEYQKTFRWYRRRSEKIADLFEAKMQEAIEKIAANPDRWPRSDNLHRWFRVRGFPFFLYYRILDTSQVLILAVAHGRRRPGYWRRRKPFCHPEK
jgi:plasmid stabilization system protein ParE